MPNNSDRTEIKTPITIETAAMRLKRPFSRRTVASATSVLHLGQVGKRR